MLNALSHGLRTPNEGINQRNLKIWADVAEKICLGRTLTIWDWEFIFVRAVKAIYSLGVRSPWARLSHLYEKIGSIPRLWYI